MTMIRDCCYIILLRPVYTMRVRLRSRKIFNIVVNGMVRDSGRKDQSKTQTQTHSINEPLSDDIFKHLGG